ncbi:MAG TPA: hypothetical protein VHS27_10875 [Gaiellales bacterium]|jgi:hypothetical protein|nr:hypothetical protein [Gaiellales bacterium]
MSHGPNLLPGVLVSAGVLTLTGVLQPDLDSRIDRSRARRRA